MDKTYSSIDDILNDSDFGDIFAAKPKAAPITTDTRLIESFEEINRFIDNNQREPLEANDISERRLYSRLLGFRADKVKSELLAKYDRHKLLSKVFYEPKSIDDILQDDDLSQIFEDENSIFDLKHVSHSSKRQGADFVARRKVCKNFAQYEPLFKECQAELKSGKRNLIKFNESNLVEKTFFILNGVLGYLVTIKELYKGKDGKPDGRIHCVFENGTESNMLFRSLCKRLYENGKLITSSNSEVLAEFSKGFNLVTDEDTQTGFIYILKSKSTNPKINSIENLYKIGYSTIPVEERIKNAENEPTYLMAPVEVISIYQCYNLNPQKFEHIIHSFFAQACLNLDVFGEDGKRYNPREWFILPLIVIEEAIAHIISGEISQYQFDAARQDGDKIFKIPRLY
jgi:hypothetical protein